MSDFITLGDCTYRPETDTQRGPQWRRLANGDHIDITFTNDPEWTIPEWQALALALDEIVRLRAEVERQRGIAHAAVGAEAYRRWLLDQLLALETHKYAGGNP